ncbi:carbohydrate ABC transporter permease [Mycetocola manganoxydans]|uniref:Carbohydrate ABC transporter permease n=1 Tax=Mycetocola manganoxydans TaxID=699879 RepID=A0A3L6ZZN6_9MICO|nr:carbohydrate ABC transporter permease [Mycetocola manganoxydans]RLP73419.1 carbohydrate ABC transporter permease [Mycetocola manganoxydans]GHD41797.1 ABC transporter permease [Mycetocola manganoxydans]
MATTLVPSTPKAGRAAAASGPRREVGERRPLFRSIVLIGMCFYFLVPLWWLIVASTKTVNGLFNGSAGSLWFDKNIDLFGNLAQLFNQSGGIYLQWLGNSFLYALTGGVGATVLAVLAGYGFAKYAFRGRNVSFALLLGSVMVPVTALVLPTFVLFSAIGLNNTIWAVILPSLLSPFGVYLMRVYAQDAVPDELIEAARIDGAGDAKIFFSIALPLLRPAIATVLLLSIVATWNNYFLPLAVLSDPKLFPVTVGLGQWLQLSAAAGGGQQLWNLIVIGALVSVIPLILAFVFLQRYWQGGLSLGSLK